MAMASMKQKEGGGDMPICAQSNPYGYGLTICLSEDQVEALGLDKNPPKAGTQVGLRCIAIVQRVTQEAVTDRDDPAEIEVSLSLQITDMEVSGAPASSAALYETKA